MKTTGLVGKIELRAHHFKPPKTLSRKLTKAIAILKKKRKKRKKEKDHSNIGVYL